MFKLYLFIFYIYKIQSFTVYRGKESLDHDRHEDVIYINSVDKCMLINFRAAFG